MSLLAALIQDKSSNSAPSTKLVFPKTLRMLSRIKLLSVLLVTSQMACKPMNFLKMASAPSSMEGCFRRILVCFGRGRMIWESLYMLQDKYNGGLKKFPIHS
ncbi:hypothetical protein BOTNAR_0475g00050 [Botryotinia narcissicola]|uniref:Uncharacterized protein n=1 Tax=Botryotinia narcissicola TaxID=278944 RepID=A0A4Z1HH70_9HELO|nr:hypothetical protein BOTNAR_0475g00050 [Botryotinia narcissicola]